MDQPTTDNIQKAVIYYGMLAIALLFIAAMHYNDRQAMILALLSAAAAYVGMVVLVDPSSMLKYRIAIIVNPTMTVASCSFWLLGLIKIWG